MITKDNVIKLQKPNISVEVFDVILNSDIDFSKNAVKTNVAILIAADELCLNILCDSIENYLLDNKESLKKNFVLIQNVAAQFTQFIKLDRFCKIAIRNDPLLVFKADDFTTIKQEMLLDILKKNNYSVKSIVIWDKLIEWSIAQPDEGLPSDISKWTHNDISTFKTIIQPFIPHIDFKTISPLDFFKKIKPFKNVFDDVFYVQILEYYSFNNYIHSTSNFDSKIINSEQSCLLGNSIKL
ncbi:16011_t:CDS:2, partial [Funneliformis geosporum]